MNVARSSVRVQAFPVIAGFILERNRTNVISVANPLFTAQTSIDIRKSILERNLTTVTNVARSSLKTQAS